MKKIKQIILHCNHENAREIIMNFLYGLRTVIGNIKRFYRIHFKISTQTSVKSYGATDLIKDINCKYDDKNILLEIEPPYFLQLSFYNFVLQNYAYNSCIEMGSYKGELLNILAANNKNIYFTGFDINKNIENINTFFDRSNLSFKYYAPNTYDFLEKYGEGTLLISKAVLMYLNENEILDFFSKANNLGIDIALVEPTMYKYNAHSKILNANSQAGFKSFSHPYALYLQRLGYNIIYDSNILSLGYYKFNEYSPYYLTFVYASKNKYNSFMDGYREDLNSIMGTIH
jgi:hypothetical protein